MLPELACELRRYPAVKGQDRIFPPKLGARSGRQRVEGSFEDLLQRAGIEDFRFHDLCHTFAFWCMMNGGDLYELAKILGHSNIKMTERYAKLARQHIARTGSTARGNVETAGSTEVVGSNNDLRHGEHPVRCSRVVCSTETLTLWLLVSALECGGQGRS
ncbi:MAG: site-specific integrase [Candidatus Sulfotelmatobacter sp.]